METEALKKDWEARMRVLEQDEEKLRREREKLLTSSKAEARRIVNERTAEAEELLAEIEKIFEKETLTERDLIQARTLKNTMKRGTMPEEEAPIRAVPINPNTLKEGDKVRVGSMNVDGTVLSVNKNKGTAEVQTGALRVKAKFAYLYALSGGKKEKKAVTVTRNLTERSEIRPEVNLIGMTVGEMEPELMKFLDSAVLANFTEVRVVHGMGTGKLRAAVHTLLKKHKRVESFRLGKYGEGESGVTIVTLK